MHVLGSPWRFYTIVIYFFYRSHYYFSGGEIDRGVFLDRGLVDTGQTDSYPKVIEIKVKLSIRNKIVKY